jgi:hypothetical protein
MHTQGDEARAGENLAQRRLAVTRGRKKRSEAQTVDPKLDVWLEGDKMRTSPE